jgi:hypothetical protein
MSTPAFIPDSPAAPPASSAAPPPAAAAPSATPGFVPDTDQAAAPPAPSTDPGVTGEIVNDVGNKVIVPKDGEDFSATMLRAIQHYRSMTPEQQQEAYRKEAQTIPEKSAESLGGAALAGFGGGAALASPIELHAALGAGFKALLPALTSGVVGMGTWAEEHPIAARALWEGLKVVMTGTAAGAGARIAGKIIKASPNE